MRRRRSAGHFGEGGRGRGGVRGRCLGRVRNPLCCSLRMGYLRVVGGFGGEGSDRSLLKRIEANTSTRVCGEMNGARRAGGRRESQSISWSVRRKSDALHSASTPTPFREP